MARAGQIAAATENSIAEPAPSSAETKRGLAFFRSSRIYDSDTLMNAAENDGPSRAPAGVLTKFRDRPPPTRLGDVTRGRMRFVAPLMLPRLD